MVSMTLASATGATLDGFWLFKFGVDRPDDVLPALLTNDFDTCTQLDKLPGLVGDIEPNNNIGYITLVRNSTARADKLYG